MKNVSLIAQHEGETHDTSLDIRGQKYSSVNLGTHRKTKYRGLHHTV